MDANIEQVSSSERFESLLRTNRVVLVDFWATWCGPCQAQLPVLGRVAHAMEDKAKILKINVDDNNELAANYGVQSIPTLLIFEGGKEVQRFVGLQDEATLTEALETAASTTA